MNEYMLPVSRLFGTGMNPWFFVLLLVWTLPWKGVALWHAARNRQYVWFMVILILNTAAILEIIYLFGFVKQKSGTVVTA